MGLHRERYGCGIVMALPYFKFMVQDWLSGNIQACDLQTQGVFINLLAMSWRDGGSYKQPAKILAHRCHIDEAKLEEALNLMKELGVIYVDDNGYLRIKFLDEQLGELSQEHERKVLNGIKGAEVRYGKPYHSKAIAKPCHTDAETKSESESESDTPIKTTRLDKAIVEQIIATWNEYIKDTPLTKLSRWGKNRNTHYKARLSEFDGDHDELWKLMKEQLSNLGEFAKGKNASGWMITFDWIMKSEDNFTKFIEGNYRYKGTHR